MSYVILDLEWNGSYSKILNKFVNEIIEFGAIKVDEELNIIDTFSVLIAPKIGKKLCSKVKELTKITNEELMQDGIGFINALSMFSEFLGDDVLMTWSDSDLHALTENYSYYTGNVRLPFLKKYCNIQKYCENCLDLHDKSAQLGLSACADIVGITYSQEEQHRAFADAVLSLECLAHFKDSFSLSPFIVEADNAEFYNRLLFKNHFITNINSREIDRSQMNFDCNICGRQVSQTSKWRLHNKNFTADFYCEDCKKKFTGRVSFKKTFDRVIVKKRLNEKKDKQKDADKQSADSVEQN